MQELILTSTYSTDDLFDASLEHLSPTQLEAIEAGKGYIEE